MKLMMIVFLCILSMKLIALEDQLLAANVEDIKKTFETEIKKQNVTDERKFYLYLWAGKHFSNFKMYDQSSEYLSKAVEMKIEQDKSYAYLNLLAFYHAKYIKDKEIQTLKKLVSISNDAQLFYQKSPKYKNDGNEMYLSFYRYHYADIDGPARQKLLEKFKNNSDMMLFTLEQNQYQLLEQKKYSELFSSFDQKNVDRLIDRQKLLFDIANLHTNKSSVKELKCSAFAQKYSTSNHYTIKLCNVLSHFLKTKQVDKKLLSAAAKSVKEQAPQYEIMLVAVKELSK